MTEISERLTRLRTLSGINTLPSSSINKAILISNQLENTYYLDYNFEKNLGPKEENKREIIDDFLHTLNKNSRLFPWNQSTFFLWWVLAWLVSFAIFIIAIWLAVMFVIFSLFNPIFISFCAWSMWFLFTHLPIFILGIFERRNMKPINLFLSKYNKETKYGINIVCSSDGSYLELFFEKDIANDSVVMLEPGLEDYQDDNFRCDDAMSSPLVEEVKD